MGLFNKKEETKIEEEKVVLEEQETPVVKVATKKKSDKAVAKIVATKSDAQMAYDFIIKPWITEKAQELMSANKYVFKLKAKTTKREAKVAVERLYNVRVEDVNIINIPSKKRRFGRNQGMKSAVRKAVVTLKEGDKIEIFE